MGEYALASVVDAEGSFATYDEVFPDLAGVAHRADWDFFVERTKRSYGERFRRLLGDGRLELLDEGGSVAPGLVAVPTPGHTPGHMSLRVGVDGVILGDVAVHPAQVARPELVYVGGDVEPEAAAATRRRFLAELCEEGLLVGAGHFPGDGFGRVVERGDSFAWKPAG